MMNTPIDIFNFIAYDAIHAALGALVGGLILFAIIKIFR